MDRKLHYGVMKVYDKHNELLTIKPQYKTKRYLHVGDKTVPKTNAGTVSRYRQ